MQNYAFQIHATEIQIDHGLVSREGRAHMHAVWAFSLL